MWPFSQGGVYETPHSRSEHRQPWSGHAIGKVRRRHRRLFLIPAPQPAPRFTAELLPIYGYVDDTAFRPIAGVSVQIIDGPQAGTTTSSDAGGRFSYDGTFTSPGRRCGPRKDGYTTATRTTLRLTDGHAYAGFSLASVTPPVAVAGNYTLTISADTACTALPEDVRTRTYRAVVIANPYSSTPGTSFNGTVAGGQFAPSANIILCWRLWRLRQYEHARRGAVHCGASWTQPIRRVHGRSWFVGGIGWHVNDLRSLQRHN